MSKTKAQVPIGTHAGRALTDIITNTIIKTRAAVAPAESEEKRRHIEGMMEDWEVDLGEFVGKLITGGENPGNLPGPLQEIIDRAIGPTHQIDFIVNLVAAFGGVLGALMQLGSIYWRDLEQNFNTQHQNVVLSPADLADGVERNIIDGQTAANEAAKSGVGGQVLQWMIDLTGEPPGVIDMVKLWRQGRLDEHTLNKMIEYSRIRLEWTEQTKLLAYDVLSGADAIEARVKGVVNDGTAQKMWQQAGGLSDQYQIALDSAGEAIGVVEAGNLYNHGLISEDDFKAVIAYSRINPRFEPISELQRFHWLSPFQVHQALAAGAIDAATAVKWMMEDGYPEDQAKAFAQSGGTTKAAKTKQVALSVVVDNYEAGLITQAQAMTQLGNLGYTSDEAETELLAYDARKLLTIKASGITSIRKAYLADVLTRNQASSQLDSLGIDSTIRDHYLTLWDIEAKSEFKQLTAAQLGDMYKNGIISLDYVMARWEAMGYSQDDAALLSYRYGNALPGNGGPVV